MILYFKVEPGNPVFDALKALLDKKVAANKDQEEYCEKIGCKPNYLIDSDGRMIAVQFENGKPEGWKDYDRQYPGYFQPKAKNTKAWGEFWEIPYVKRQEWNDVIGFKSATTAEDRGLVRHGGYALETTMDKSAYLLQIHSACGFNREHLTEITGTQYTELTKKPETV